MSYRQILANLLTKSAAERMPPGWREPAEHVSLSGRRNLMDPTRPAQYKQDGVRYPITKQQEVARRLSLTARNTGMRASMQGPGTGRPASWHTEGYPMRDVRRHFLPIGHPRDPQD